MEDFETKGLTNWFEGKTVRNPYRTDNYTQAVPFLNIRNGEDRTSVFEIELRDKKDHILADFQPKKEDQVSLALSVLGVGRVTERVEAQAAILAENLRDEEERLLERAVEDLYAIHLLRQKKKANAEKDLDDAFALYKLAYPKSGITREDFPKDPNKNLAAFWVQNLKKIRKDPTVLGSL